MRIPFCKEGGKIFDFFNNKLIPTAIPHDVAVAPIYDSFFYLFLFILLIYLLFV